MKKLRKILISPQAFKGTLKAFQVAEAIERGVLRVFPDLKTLLVPISDGGDGMLEIFHRILGVQLQKAVVSGPDDEKIEVEWGVHPDGKTAIIETALICGLHLIPIERRNPLVMTSYGVGEVIKEALDLGFRRFLIGLGGSGTTDAGMGMGKALEGDSRVKDSTFTIACDVQNPLVGPEGTARVYAPQKGATPEIVEKLEHRMEQFAKKVQEDLGINVRNIPRGGAAGGLGIGCVYYLNGKLTNGSATILNGLNYDHFLSGVDLVITGEGTLDKQTLFQKAPFSVAKRAKQRNIPVVALVGRLKDPIEIFDAIYPTTFYKSQIENPEEKIEIASEQMIRLTSLSFHSYSS